MAITFNTVRTRLLTIFILSMLALSIAAIINAIVLTQTASTYEELVTVDAANAIALGKVNQDFKTQVQEWKNVLLRGHNEDDRNKYWEKFLSKQQDIQKQGKLLSSAPIPSNVKASLRQFVNEHAAILSQYQAGYEAYLASEYDHKVADSMVRGIDRGPSKLLSQSIEQLSKINNQKSSELNTSSHSIQFMVFGVIATVFIASVLISARIITAKVSSPISILIQHLKRVSAGDFSQQVEVTSNSEIGQMARAIEKVRVKMAEVVKGLDRNQDELNGTSVHISNSAIALSQKADEQQHQAQEIDSATLQMGAAAKAMAENILSANRIADHVAASAKKSRDVMQSTLSSIDSSTRQIQLTSEVISQLDADTQTVGTVVEVINGIAEQTNLLALNAAIEAARAGEQGRGFAVVADEVRTLASRTQQSTEEIKHIIAKLQERAVGAVSQIKEGERSVQQTQASVNEASVVLEEVDTAVADITARNKDITATLDEQTQLNTSIEQKVVALKTTAEQNKQQANTLVDQNGLLEQVRAELEKQLVSLKH